MFAAKFIRILVSQCRCRTAQNDGHYSDWGACVNFAIWKGAVSALGSNDTRLKDGCDSSLAHAAKQETT